MLESQWITWVGIVLCVSQSAIFSGLNLAFFSISRLRLEAEAPNSAEARIVLEMRRDSNYLLTTILWGNVAANTLLALLANSAMAGLQAFLFSTLLITFFGEICPQAFFSRRALRVASLFTPLLRIYQLLLMPVALPTARLLDIWLGRESVEFMRERTLRHLILRHVESESAEIAAIEGLGALNFLDLDDMLMSEEGQPIKATSIISLPATNGKLVAPKFSVDKNDPFLRRLHASNTKWVVLTDESGEPRLLMDADDFLREQMFSETQLSIEKFCHKPIVIVDSVTPLGEMISRMKYQHYDDEKQPMQRDVALLWNDQQRRVITGSDILDILLSSKSLTKGHKTVDA